MLLGSFSIALKQEGILPLEEQYSVPMEETFPFFGILGLLHGTVTFLESLCLSTYLAFKSLFSGIQTAMLTIVSLPYPQNCEV